MLSERLFSKLEAEPNTGCWLWIGRLQKDGYGEVDMGAKRIAKAHRAVWEELVGPIPGGLQVDHLCRVRSCVNPDHLELVTSWENTMRGNHPRSIVIRTGRCQRGHERSPENLYVYKNGSTSHCRPCANLTARERWAKKRAKLQAADSPRREEG